MQQRCNVFHKLLNRLRKRCTIALLKMDFQSMWWLTHGKEIRMLLGRCTILYSQRSQCDWRSRYPITLHETLIQLCPTAARGPHAAQLRVLCGPVYVYGVVKVSYIWQPVLILIVLNLTFLMQVVLSACLSRLISLQLRFEHFQYISLS